MYLTNEKKLNYSLSGSYYTRKWNDCCPYVYFEKVYGGHSLLKKAANISKYNEISFHSSMIKENQVNSWEAWQKPCPSAGLCCWRYRWT